MEKKEIFLKVRDHLLAQGKKSASVDGTCFYRSPDGLKCAAGCLIEDSEYTPFMEGLSWCTTTADTSDDDIAEADAISGFEALVNIRQRIGNEGLVNCLQYMHDAYTPAEWPERLRDIARKFDIEA